MRVATVAAMSVACRSCEYGGRSGADSVSYTHLDVYKRQVDRRRRASGVPFAFVVEQRTDAMGSLDLVIAGPGGHHRPQDVYKRQAIAYRDLDRTCAELADGASWRRLLGPLVRDSAAVVGLLLGDKRSVPGSLPTALRLGLRMLAQGTPAWGSLVGEDARALFTGVAAHVISRVPSMAAAGAGLMLATLAHSVGWPIPVGGSRVITDALIDDLRANGGELTADVDITSPPGPPGSVVAFDTAPTALLRVYGDRCV